MYLRVLLPPDRQLPGYRNFVNYFPDAVKDVELGASGKPRDVDYNREAKNQIY